MADDSETLPLVSPPFDERTRDSGRDRPRVAGILLAAGTSSRFGDRNKLLAMLDGEPIVRHAARTLLESGLDPVVVVVGHEAERVATALDGLGVSFVTNDDYATGQASSVRTGIQTLLEAESPVDAAVLALGDMPFVAPETIETLVDAYVAGVGDALAAAHNGVRGNPVLFDRRFFGGLADISGDVGGREILLRSGAGARVAVPDPGVRRDIDEPTDLD
ncbi:nucleotidyltransferase family protein [Halobellus captivus]|uniref:nucleotidyltransferase family protein n=1 Tax=Halobellus captivus TaxID=2592614 RepID=UPI00119EA079|nr:nucleotidyltransferase family protein [Halobellus captivus]